MAHVGKGTEYFSEQVNRLGTTVYYYRRSGFKKIRLDAPPNSAAMDRAFYAAAKKVDALAEAKASGIPVEPDRPMVVCKPTTNPEYVKRFGDVAEPGAIGSVRWLVGEFEVGDHLRSLEKWCGRGHMRNLRYLCAFRTKDGKDAFGDFDARLLERKHVVRVRDSLRPTPAKADLFVKSVRLMFNWAQDQIESMATVANPGARIKGIWKSDGHWTMEPEHVAQYEAFWAIGTPQRAALALMYYAGVRLSDAHLMGPFHRKVRGTELHWTERKGSCSTAISEDRPEPKPRELEIHPELARVLDGTSTKGGRYVLNREGKPYASANTLGREFKKWCLQAGLPAESCAHSVRKGAAARMYENGASEAELCSIFGWEIGSQMAAWYAKKYSKKRAQSTGLARLTPLPTKEAA
jgi:integrase